MADTMTKEARSALMSRIRGDNLKPERLLAEALAASKDFPAAWVRNPKELPGKPDFVFACEPPLAVFVHGCYWHCCPAHWRLPKTGRQGWGAKFASNRARDKRVRRKLRAAGHRTMVVWEHDLKNSTSAAAVVAKIARKINQ